METKEKKHDEKHHEKDHKSGQKETKRNNDFESMTKDELYELAKERDIHGKSEMNKEQLIQALKGTEGNGHGKSDTNGHTKKGEEGSKEKDGLEAKEKGNTNKNFIKIESNKPNGDGDSNKHKNKSTERKSSKKQNEKKGEGEGETSWWKKIFS